MVVSFASTTRLGMMTSSAEDCWRLSRECGRWAAEIRDSAARLAFRQMATAWARLAFAEEFTSPTGEQKGALNSENDEITPAGKLALSLLVPPSEIALPEGESRRDWHNSTRKSVLAVTKRLFATMTQVAFSVGRKVKHAGLTFKDLQRKSSAYSLKMHLPPRTGKLDQGARGNVDSSLRRITLHPLFVSVHQIVLRALSRKQKASSDRRRTGLFRT